VEVIYVDGLAFSANAVHDGDISFGILGMEAWLGAGVDGSN
jgi:hypothetical protein